MSELRIEVVDPRDDEALAAWHAVYSEAEVLGQEDTATVWQLEELRVMLQARGIRAWSQAYVGILDGSTVASGWMRTPLLDNVERAELGVHVLPSHQRRGLGSAMLAHLEAEASRRGRSILIGEAHWPHDRGSDGAGWPGREFARSHGFSLALGDVQQEMPLPVADEVLQEMSAEAAPHHAAYTLRSWAGPVPDDLAPGFAQLLSVIGVEAPTGELELEPEVASVEALREQEDVLLRQGRTKHSTVALDAMGEAVACSDIVTTVHEPGRAYQWGTIVRRDHRGHRLGLAVKVANLRLLQREGPDIVRLITWNAESNAHMIGVNERMGFRPVARLGELQKKLGQPARRS